MNRKRVWSVRTKRMISKVLSGTVLAAALLGALPAAGTGNVKAAETEVPENGLIADYSFSSRPGDGKTIANRAAGADAVKDAVVQNESTAKWEDQALVFDGNGTSGNPTGTWVSLPDNILSGKTSATINMEVKPSAAIITKNHFMWSIGNSGTDTYWFANAYIPRTSMKYGGSEKTAASQTKLKADGWYSYTGVIDAEKKTISLYIDGEKVAETKAEGLSLDKVSDQSQNTIGRAPYNDPLFQGSVSSFRVYDRALSSDEILALSENDAALHTEIHEAEAKAVCDHVADVEITDAVMRLPDYDGKVTWTSDVPEITVKEDGVTASVIQPEPGEKEVKGTLTATANVRGCTAQKKVSVAVKPKAADEDPYGYLMVHFMGSSTEYWEKVYLDISRGNNPEQWDPLNGGEPVMASAAGTTGVRDPSIVFNPDTETYYIIATDLRVIGGDNAGWGNWTTRASTKINVWESKDLIHWSDLRQFDVALNQDGSKAAELGMMWAPEATWVEDYYGEGKGAFVLYWSSTVFANASHTNKTPTKVLWGATTDFTQDTYEYGGVWIEKSYAAIDAAVIQNEGTTYRCTKNDDDDSLFFEKTQAKKWWLPDAQWELIQDKLGKNEILNYNVGIEGPALFKSNTEERWYMYVDDPTTYVPLTTDDLDKGWKRVESESQYLRVGTHHGGVINLTKKQYDTIRSADAGSPVKEDLGEVKVKTGSSMETVLQALPKTAEANLHYNYGTADIPVNWDISSVDVSKTGRYEVKGTLATIGANDNQWVGRDGSTAWNAEDRELYSSTEILVKAVVWVTEDADSVKPIDQIFEDVSADHWYVPYAQFVFDRGIMKGLDKTHFGPDVKLSRAQFATILYRMEGEPEAEYSPVFSDVPDEAFYTEAVMWASGEDVGVINGYENGTFGPSDLITREQMATMMLRYAAYKGYDTKERSDFAGFPDKDKVSEFAADGMSWAVAESLITGDQGRLNPQGDTSRAVCATIIKRFMDTYE